MCIWETEFSPAKFKIDFFVFGRKKLKEKSKQKVNLKIDIDEFLCDQIQYNDDDRCWVLTAAALDMLLSLYKAFMQPKG